MNRRNVVKVLFGGAVVLQLPAAEPGAPLFFTREEFALLDTLTELLIPADDHSPGAREAGVATFIDRSVAEAFVAEEKESWRKGLAAIDSASGDMMQAPFLKISAKQQNAVLRFLAAKEHKPETEAEKFFTQLKQTTAFVYYSSSIGIHNDMQYKGNVLLPQFVGYDAT